MAVDESSRHDLRRGLEEVLGPQRAATLMAHLPPVPHVEVATKRDLDERFQALQAKLDARFGGVDARFGGVDARFQALEAKLDARFESIDARFEAVGFQIEAAESRIETKMERALRAQTRTFFGYAILGNGVTVLGVLALLLTLGRGV